jgi:predicted CoA-binding protein
VNRELARRILEETKTIAVVGCSEDWWKPGTFVPTYLQQHGYRIVPINPKRTELLGERCYPSLTDVDVPVDCVEVFRPAGEAPALARDAVAIGARFFWLQEEIVSEEAAEIAREGGLEVVMNACMGVLHGELGLGPGVQPPEPPDGAA